jgi:hypothetical protein
MPHSLTIGMTLSGKTTLNRLLAHGYMRRGIKTAVLDPLRDPAWRADMLTPDRAAFMAFVRTNKSRALFVDESGSAIDRHDTSTDWLTTTSRHLGHAAHFIAHRPQQLSVTLRLQCTRLYLFTVSDKDARLLADEWNCPALLDCSGLAKGEFVFVERFRPVQRGAVDFKRQRVSFHQVQNAA